MRICLIDTPGRHDGKNRFEQTDDAEVAAALEGIDVLLLMVDAPAAV